MRILIVDRYFWPDYAPHSQMSYKIALKLSGAGNEVSVLTAFPSYNWDNSINVPYSEVSHGVNIRRLPLLPEFGRKIFLRMINTGLFLMQIVFCLSFRRTDLVIVSSLLPVFLAMFIRYLSKIKKFRYIYHCQDIHPEAMLIAGIISNGFIYKALRYIDKRNVNEAAVTVVLSEDMKETLVKRGVNKKNIKIINNFIFDTIPMKIESCIQNDKYNGPIF